MEILIIGIIIVGLMVYLSTKIKKEAKLAYEREAFEDAHFAIVKPEGFLIPITEDSPYVFEAHSKEFGDDDARDFYRCRATVTVKNEAGKREFSEAETTENNVSVKTVFKSLSDLKNRKTYELEIKVLSDYAEEFAGKLKEMTESFRIKNV